MDAHLLLCLLLGCALLVSDVLGSHLLQLTLARLRCPLSQLVVRVHMAQAAPAEVTAGVKVVCQGCAACTPKTA